MKRNNLTILPYEAPQADLLLVRTEQNFLASSKNAVSRGFVAADTFDEDDWEM